MFKRTYSKDSPYYSYELNPRQLVWRRLLTLYKTHSVYFIRSKLVRPSTEFLKRPFIKLARWILRDERRQDAEVRRNLRKIIQNNH